MKRTNHLACAALIFLPVAGTAWAEELTCGHMVEWSAAAAPLSFDAATGARPEHVPTPVTFDIEHIRLDLTFEDLSTRTMKGSQVIVFSSPWGSTDLLSLDAVGMTIHSVERLEDAATEIASSSASATFGALRGLEYFHSGEKLLIALSQPVEEGARAAVRIDYTVTDPERGLWWIEPVEGGVESTWQVWSQGQDENNRYWFATHDYPNENHTSELIARVPPGNIVSAAGILVEKSMGSDGLDAWHWRMEQPHVSYLTSLAIGDFHVEREEWEGIQVEYYMPQRFRGDVRATFGATVPMLEFFSSRFGEKYPYARYAQVVVDEYMYGGMENITASTLVNRVVQGPAADRYARACGENRENLIAHELGHQWFGDLMTCRTWSHTWLNEGWAAYCEALWAEHACGRDEYDYRMWKRHNSVAASDRPESRRPLVYVALPDDESAFSFNGGAVYGKGASLLHTLRQHLGDEAFFAGTELYIDRHKFGVVTTDMFRQALEHASGRDLERWFRQWLHTPGTPTLDIALEYNPATRAATVTVEQTQQIDEVSPAFFGEVELWFGLKDESTTTRRVFLEERRHSFTVALPAAPVSFGFDPQGAFLSARTLKAPVEMLAQTVTSAPALRARLDAIAALGGQRDPSAIATLKEIALDQQRFYGERILAIEKLADSKSPLAPAALGEAADAALAGGPDGMDWRIRRAVARSLHRLEPEVALEPLLAMAKDPSEPVASDAITGLRNFEDDRVGPALLAAAERRGEHEYLLDAAVDGIAHLRYAPGLDAAIRCTLPDVDQRVRPSGIQAIVALLERQDLEEGHHAADHLITLLDDTQARVRSSAARALGTLQYEPAKAPLERMMARESSDRIREAAAAALAEIGRDQGTPEEFRKLQAELRLLKLQIEERESGARSKGEFKFRDAQQAPEKKKRKKFLGIF